MDPTIAVEQLPTYEIVVGIAAILVISALGGFTVGFFKSLKRERRARNRLQFALVLVVLAAAAFAPSYVLEDLRNSVVVFVGLVAAGALGGLTFYTHGYKNYRHLSSHPDN
ncbi:MAG TPA: hypothetical protein QF873_03100 [Patescibacteria group bacterium]|nr:hypothetical protein [Patescibacteria group bacterium]